VGNSRQQSSECLSYLMKAENLRKKLQKTENSILKVANVHCDPGSRILRFFTWATCKKN